MSGKSVRRTVTCLILPVVAVLWFPRSSLFGAERVVEREFTESARVIRNPDCGWIAYNYEDPYGLCRRAAGGSEPFPYASVIYTRHPRNRWETPAGSFAGSAPVKLLENWIEHERYVAFRVYANGTSQLPPKLRGKVGLVGEGSKKGLAYWDGDYVEDHRRLVNYLGRRFGDSPYLAFVDIGGVGNTGGEWYFSPERYSGTALDEETVYDLVRRFVAMYERAFPRTRLFISYDCVHNAGERSGEVMKLLKDHDIGLRDDGLGGWPYPRRHPPLNAWPMPLFWREVPVCFEGSGRGGGVYGWTLQDKRPERILQWAFERCRPSYVNVGGSESTSATACSELSDILIRWGRRLGYRFVLLKASCPAELVAGRQAELSMLWANRGIAPCYVNRPIEVSLFDPDGNCVAAVSHRPDPATTDWTPERETEVRLPFTVPADVAPGQYSLKLRMLLADPRAPARPVDVATRGADGEGRFTVGDVRVRGR